ncbi:UNVERIFIED_CONTAM: hypothetical protein GTU68_060651 [Idotea baltica]|nr:hypothetical protein [Idotea baltica]
MMIGGILIAFATWYSARKGYPRDAMPTLKGILTALKNSAWGLGLPLILLGGIYSGVFTPTESAAAACLYGWFVGAVIYRSISVRDTLMVLRNTGLISGPLLLITAGASAFSWVLASTGTPAQLAAYILGDVSNPFLIIAFFNVLLLIAGCFLDSASAIIILAPLMMPIAQQIGVDPIHFGVIMLVNLSVGMLTPPVGLNLFVAMGVSGMKLGEVFLATLPTILLMLVALILLSYIPAISMLLPETLF